MTDAPDRWATRRARWAGYALILGFLCPIVETSHRWDRFAGLSLVSVRLAWFWEEPLARTPIGITLHLTVAMLALATFVVTSRTRGETRGRWLAGLGFAAGLVTVIQGVVLSPPGRELLPILLTLLGALAASGLAAGNHARKEFPAASGARRLTTAAGAALAGVVGVALAPVVPEILEGHASQSDGPVLALLPLFGAYAVLGLLALRRPRGRSRLPTTTSVLGYLLVAAVPAGFLAMAVLGRGSVPGKWSDAVTILKVSALGAGTLLVFATGVAEWTGAVLRAGTRESRAALGEVFR